MNEIASTQVFNPPAIRPLRILYADDVLQLREFMTVMLAREGHLVETVEDGADALEWIERAPTAFDLLITDHHMPRLNGLELVRAVRHLPFAGKIIVFSSELNELVHERYRRLNVDLILPKPIFPVTFRQLLKELYAHPAAS
jgi:CheY-like chemotaxis protein